MKFAACLSLCAFMLCAAQPAKEVFDRAAQALAAGDYETAERGFQTVLREQPHHVAALSNLGIVYSHTNRSDRAIEVYRRALRESPDDKVILVNLGLLYLKQEAYATALPLFAKVVALDPQQRQARQLLAVCRVYTGDLAPAIGDLEALRTASPGDDGILFLLGFAYLKNHETERAKETFQSMFDAAGPVRARFLLGKALYEATQFPQAEESFLEVFRLDPQFPGLHLELGKVYISLHRNEDAIRELESALKFTPADGDASYFLGAVLVQEGRFADSLPYLERANMVKPDFWAPYFYLGRAKLRLKQTTEAVGLLQRAVALNPDEASAYYQYAQALKASGRSREAHDAMLKAQSLSGAAENSTTDGHVAGAR